MHLNNSQNSKPMFDHFLANKPNPIKNNKLRSLKTGQPIFYEGDTARGLYEVVEGVVRNYKLTADGRRQIVSFGYPGDIIGINHDGCHHNDCDAISDVTLKAIDQKTDTDFAYSLIRYTAAELTLMHEHFLLLGRKSAMEKVASFLNVLQNRIGKRDGKSVCYDLPMNRTDIADYLGLSIETVSRCFSKLRQEGIIGLPQINQVCIYDLGALQGLTEVEH
ncbi:helix-turn-helix domain-containing protein [Amylibacter sp. SFDW26]|uniref:helix-turn-helix domain-containing protein n=1 Tax=Amylibacter sp. SFDW26 TaxID=2652722 RepID=UPI0012621C22|nr:helix-turn-helix domain-containing protein [Amylibacter sp. SFDW26]KAB7614449.1 helix-turn-helix domain-containing protein [Amylibacter sp. SFDW26]